MKLTSTSTRSASSWLVIPVLLLASLLMTKTAAASSTCQTNNYPTYSVILCLTNPENGTTLSDVPTVGAIVKLSGSPPNLVKLIFYLNDEYLLTDYEPPYAFYLPTTKFVDGAYTLSVEAIMGDKRITQRAIISMTFDNGISTPPVNENTFTPRVGTTPAPGQPFVVAATGDGASGEWPEVTDLMASWNPNMVLYLGDVYDEGTTTEFYNWYGQENEFFGQFKSITNPTIGNHEYEEGEAAGYFDYWDNVPHYYSVDAAGWHFVTIDSTTSYRQTQPGTPQYDWLVQDLANNTSACTMVFMHHPSFNIGNRGISDKRNELWPMMVQYGVDVVLAGHDHTYQRWLPMDANGMVVPHGATHFIAGAGGHGVRPFEGTDPRVAVGFDSSPEALGALRMELNPKGLSFEYINIEGVVLDSGAIACDVEAPELTTNTKPPSPATDTTANVSVAWSARPTMPPSPDTRRMAMVVTGAASDSLQ